MKKNQYLLITGTPRSGGKLISNIYAAKKNCLSISELLYFFRHIYKKYKSFSKKNLFLMSGEICLRIKYRNEISISHKNLYKYLISKQINNYSKLYVHLFEYLKSYFRIFSSVNIEGSTGEWRNIDDFLKLNKNFKSIQYIRDPRAVLSSFKKISFMKKYEYYLCLFQWIDSVQTSLLLKRKYNKKKYLLLKFEDLHNFPKSSCKKILNFANLKYNKKDFTLKNWKKRLNTSFHYANISSYDLKPKYGFNKKRNISWKKYLKKWEVLLVEHICKKEMNMLGYQTTKKINNKMVDYGLKKIKSNKKIKKKLDEYAKFGNIKNIFFKDASNPKNWSSNKNPLKKFKDEKEYNFFLKERRKIQNINFIS